MPEIQYFTDFNLQEIMLSNLCQAIKKFDLNSHFIEFDKITRILKNEQES